MAEYDCVFEKGFIFFLNFPKQKNASMIFPSLLTALDLVRWFTKKKLFKEHTD